MRWTKEEISILREKYSDLTMDDLEKLISNRTGNAINCKASELRLKKSKLGELRIGRLTVKKQGRAWSAKEIRILKENYLRIPYKEMVNLLPRRTADAIQLKATRGIIRKRFREYNPDLTITENLAYLLGIILGDGCIYKNSIVLTTSTKKFNAEFGESIKKIGLMPHHDLDHGYYRTRAFSRKFCEYFRSLTLSKIETLISKKKEFILAFIKGFYESEGGFNQYEYLRKTPKGTDYVQKSTKVTISNTNENLIKLIELLLIKLGSKFKLSKYITPKGKPYYVLSISNRQLALSFLEKIKPCIKGGNVI